MISEEPHLRLIEEFNSTLTQDMLKEYALKYLLTHTYVKTVNIAKHIIAEEFEIVRFTGYDRYITSITCKMIRIIVDLKKSGIIERYSPRLYKVVKKNIEILN